MAKNIVKKNEMILHSTVETHSCDPKEDCPECDGSGKCHHCSGRGENDCDDCHGRGDCQDCHGRGEIKCDNCHGSGQCTSCHGRGGETCSNCAGRGVCPECGGSKFITCLDCRGTGYLYNGNKCGTCYGTGRLKCHACEWHPGKCRKCKGAGQIKCSKCSGSGQCKKCHGRGDLTCNTCSGSGRCRTCKGSGKLRCDDCHGTGNCQNCRATGKVVCSRCNGSGWYQTYRAVNATDYVMRSIAFCHCNEKNILGQATGREIYDGVYRQWKSFDEIQSDTRAERDKQVEKALGEYQSKYQECLEIVENSSDLKPASNFDGPMRNQMAVTEVDHIVVNYEINGKKYSVDILGDNHIAEYADVPTVMEEFKLSKFAKYKMALTERTRLKRMVLLASYIYGCDGWTPSEIRVMRCLVSEIEKKPEKQQKLLSQLLNTHSTITEEQLLKKIKPIMQSKKGLTFAWHCMTIDHTISPQEKQLFEKLTAMFPGITQDEVEKIKCRTAKFNMLSDEYLIKEYADIFPDYSKIRKIVYTVVAAIVALAVLIGGPIIYNKFFKPHHVYEATERVEYGYNNDLEDTEDHAANIGNSTNDIEIEDDYISEDEIPVDDFSTEDLTFEMKGIVGKSTVDMELTIDFESGLAWGYYSYPTVGDGSPIVLKGNLVNDDNRNNFYLILSELDGSGEPAGTFDLKGTITSKGKILTGKYISIKGKTFNVELIQK